MIWLFAITLATASLVCFLTSYMAAFRFARNPNEGMPFYGGIALDTLVFINGTWIAIVFRGYPIGLAVAAGCAVGGLSSVVMAWAASKADRDVRSRQEKSD
jgi:hypothetical protein